MDILKEVRTCTKAFCVGDRVMVTAIKSSRILQEGDKYAYMAFLSNKLKLRLGQTGTVLHVDQRDCVNGYCNVHKRQCLMIEFDHGEIYWNCEFEVQRIK